MKRLVISLLLHLAVTTFAKPSLNHHAYNDVYPVHPGVGAIYKGPNSETIIAGPDGSVITSEADGGAVAVEGEKAAVAAVSHAGVNQAIASAAASAAAHQSAAIASAGAYAQANAVAKAPAVLAQAPILVEEPVVVSSPAPILVEEPIIVSSPRPVIVPQPVVSPQVVLAPPLRDTTSLDGPSGSILRHGEDAVITGPSSTTIRDGKHVVDIPNIEVKTTVVGGPLHGPALGPGPVLAVQAPGPVVATAGPAVVSGPPVLGPVFSSTPGPILISTPVAPFRPRPVLIDTPHPIKASGPPVPVLVDDTHLVGSTLGTSGPLLIDDAQLLQKELILSSPGPILHDSSAISVQNEVIPQLVVSSTPNPLLVASPKAHIPVVSVSPSQEIYSTPASHVIGHANEEAISAAIAKNAEAQQSYLSALRYSQYEKALAAEANRQAALQAAAHSAHSSGVLAGPGIVGQPLLNPVVSQGNHIISGVVSSTVSPIISSTPPPVLVTSLTPTRADLVTASKELVAIGPQIFQANGIISSTPRPEIVVSSTPSPSDIEGLSLVSGPVVSHPKAVLAPSEGLGQIVVQESHSSSEARAHSSSSSSTKIISGPAVVTGGHGHRLPGAAPFGRPSSDFAEWQQSVSHGPGFGPHGPNRGYPGNRGFLH